MRWMSAAETGAMHYFDIVDFRKMKETDNVKVFGKDFMWVILMKKKAN